MKNIFYIGLLLLFLRGTGVVAEGKDTFSIRKEYLSLEPARYDSTVYEKFKKDRTYNYYRTKQDSFLKRLRDSFLHWLQKLNPDIDNKSFNTFMLIIGIALLIAIAVIVYFNRPSIFYFNRKNKLLFSIDEDDIYGRDFNKFIKDAIDRGEYSEAIRWTYIKTLETLHRKKWISWETNKTVNEYVYEIKNVELRKIFKKLSESFVRYRYGNEKADEKRFLNFETQSEQIIKWTE
ncbi:MAG: hypothetical protein LBH32_08880 [Dysgonamonadaceae bacterium]|nr:hypothetical protein [Dysgonamonadaceae bacterium]